MALRKLFVSPSEPITLGYDPGSTIDLTPLDNKKKGCRQQIYAGVIYVASHSNNIMAEVYLRDASACINGKIIKFGTPTPVPSGSILSFSNREKHFLKYMLMLKTGLPLRVPRVNRSRSPSPRAKPSPPVPVIEADPLNLPYGSDKTVNLSVNTNGTTDSEIPANPLNSTRPPLRPLTTLPRKASRSLPPRRERCDNAFVEKVLKSTSARSFSTSPRPRHLHSDRARCSDSDGQSRHMDVCQRLPLLGNNVHDLGLPPRPLPLSPLTRPGLLQAQSFHSRPNVTFPCPAAYSDTANLPRSLSIAPFVVQHDGFKTEAIPFETFSMEALTRIERTREISELDYTIISSRSAKCLKKQMELRAGPTCPALQSAQRLLDRILRIRISKGKVVENTGLITPLTEDSERSEILKDFRILIFHLKEVLQTTPPVLKLSSPIFIFGDLEASVSGLQNIYNRISLFDHFGGSNVSILFLGNYLSWTSTNLEAMGFIFAWAVLCPNVYLLRGEDEFVQGNERCATTFARGPIDCSLVTQCKLLFHEKTGRMLWSEIKSVLSRLPLVAVIDDKVFACHGGIPLLKQGKKCSRAVGSDTGGTILHKASGSSSNACDANCECQSSPIKWGPCRFVPSESLFEAFLKEFSKNDFLFTKIECNEPDSQDVAERRQLVRELLLNEPDYLNKEEDFDVHEGAGGSAQFQEASFTQQGSPSEPGHQARAPPPRGEASEDSKVGLLSEPSSSFFYSDVKINGFCCGMSILVPNYSVRRFNNAALQHFFKRFGFSHLIRARRGTFIDDISYACQIISLTSNGENARSCFINNNTITLHSLNDPPLCMQEPTHLSLDPFF